MTIKLVHVVTVPMTLNVLMRDQLRYMKHKGLEVAVVASPDPMIHEVAQDIGIEAYPLPMTRAVSPVSDMASLARLLALFRRIKPTIVHGSTFKAGALAMTAATLAGVPIRFYTVRGLLAETRRGLTRGTLMAVERLTCMLAHRVLPVSRSCAEAFIDERLCSPHKMTILGHGSSNGVDAANRFNPDGIGDAQRTSLRDTLGIARDARVVGFVGRIVKDKGVDDLMQAWEVLAERRHDVVLLVIGPEEPHDPVPRSVLDTLRGHPRIVHVSMVEHADMPLYYGIIDVLTLPTHREGFPNVVLEAAAMRVPTVATRVTGCVDAIKDAKTGRLVPPRDPEALADAVSEYLARDDVRKEHGIAARKRVLLDFGRQTIWDALYHEYMFQVQLRGLRKSPATSEPRFTGRDQDSDSL